MSAAREAIDHQEVHFLAEDEKVTILPTFALAQVHLLGGTFGPFRPQIQVIVPYWLAVILKKQGRCTIVPPRWLHMHLLGSLISFERTDDVFQTLPFHYIEIATDLCKHARDDLPDWNHIFDLLETVRSVRHNKMQAGLRSLDTRAMKGVKLSNIALLEVNIMRSFMTNSLEYFRRSNSAQ